MRTLVAYVPVLHEGYRRFFEKHEGPRELYLFGSEIISEFPYLAKEIRQLEPVLMRKSIEALDLFEHVKVLDVQGAEELNTPERNIFLPDEDVSRELAARHFSRANTTFDPIFLRWDKHNSLKERPVVPDEQITREEFQRGVMKTIEQESDRSSDIWRHVGAAIVEKGKVVSIAHNHHLPTEHAPYENGDPRNNFHKGDHIEMSTAIHAEASLIAEAARKGTRLEGADMYVTVFPCPPCAKLIAESGIKTLYCGGGYGVLDGEDVLKTKGVKIIFVE
ncbi:MAG TPA: deaminase [Candidatus Paceibacterota bacterium]|nr:deaminase [Candidatus Paceibacterota bacterium]